MAERFARGGRLIAFGRSPAARSDARHVAVEFVHPVIVGKRALPALGLCGEGGTLAAQVGLLARPRTSCSASVWTSPTAPRRCAALALARERGCMTLAFGVAGGAEDVFFVGSEDPSVRQELVETLYHVLWELVHVFFEHRGLLRGRDARPIHDAGASSFLYPFLDERETELEPVLADVARSVVMKSEEVGELRAQTLGENTAVLAARRGAAGVLRRRRDVAGPRQRGLGHRCHGRGGGLPGRRAARLDAAGRPSTSPRTRESSPRSPTTSGWRRSSCARSSPTAGPVTRCWPCRPRETRANVIAALEQARRQGLVTVAMVGYDGGAIAAEALADHVIVTRSEHIPRIQEAQASAYHVLRELVG